MKLLLICAFCIASLLPAFGRDADDLKVLAAYGTTTIIREVTTTTTIPYTCASTFGTNVCKRRRRLNKSLRIQAPLEDAIKNIDGSIGDTEQLGDTSKQPRIAIVLWSSITSTYTFTSTSTNSATTFSLSYHCSVASPAAVYPPACG